MIQELVLLETLTEAQVSIQAGGDGVRDGVATLLNGIREYRENERSGGVDGTVLLNEAMCRLMDDPYLTLGVEADSDEAAIKKAYRKFALKFHPDKNKATSSLFQTVQGAHDILMEPEKRAEYDLKRKRQQEALTR